MGNDMDRVRGQDHGGSKQKGQKKVTMTAGGSVGPHPDNREGMNVTATQHAAHKRGKKK